MVKIINELELAVQQLAEGNIVALPTETVYGLAADCHDPLAVAKIFAAKNRPSDHPLIIHVSDYEMAQRYIVNPAPYVQRLVEHFWPGPLTLVFNKSTEVGYNITGGQETVAIRAPAHDSTRAIINKLARGIVAPSANKFGRVSPTSAEHVASEFMDEFKYVLDGGSCTVGIESTIIDVTNPDYFKILRPGIITKEDLENIACVDCVDGDSNIRISGALKSHYSPNKPIFVASLQEITEISESTTKNYLIICSKANFSKISHYFQNHQLIIFADHFDLSAKLYGALRLGEMLFDGIIIEQLPANKEWQALNDRIGKATYNYLDIKPE